jgi:hypothetical protein
VSNSRELDNSGRYEIVVRGRLDPVWQDWFDGFSFEARPGDETRLCGRVADQAALHGLLNKIRDLGLPLLSVLRLPGEDLKD